jgi:formyl-CoA transferase
MTIGVLGAIQGRNVTGEGQKVDISLVDAAVSAMGNINMIYLAEGRIPKRIGNRYEATYPYDSFECSDGECVIGAGNNKLWKTLCGLMGREELAEMEKYRNTSDRTQYPEELKEIVEKWTITKTAEDVVETCLAAGVPAAPIYNVAQVSKDPHIAGDREMFIEQEHPKAGKVVVTGSPLKLSGTPVAMRTVAPLLGQDNLEVFSGLLGMSEEEINALKNNGVI